MKKKTALVLVFALAMAALTCVMSSCGRDLGDLTTAPATAQQTPQNPATSQGAPETVIVTVDAQQYSLIMSVYDGGAGQITIAP